MPSATAARQFTPLHAPPGKTLLVEKLAAEARVPLLAVSPSAILSKWAGESEKTLRGVFEAAAALSPSIIFLDEVDSLAPARCARSAPRAPLEAVRTSRLAFSGGVGGWTTAVCKAGPHALGTGPGSARPHPPAWQHSFSHQPHKL